MFKLFPYLLRAAIGATVLYTTTLQAQEQSQAVATEQPVQVGQPAGDLPLPVILNAPITSGSLSSFKGKLLILDFWATWCSPCIGSMPHMLDIQKRFGDKVQVLIVASDSLDTVQDFYKRRPELKLTTAVGDKEVFSVLAKRFAIPTLGTYIWIDGNGMVRGITGGEEVTPENVQAVLDGKNVKFSLKSGLGVRKPLDRSRPFMIEDNTGGVTDVTYHSVLTSFLPGEGGGMSFGSGKYTDRRIMAFNSTPVGLIRDAITGIRGKVIETPFTGPDGKKVTLPLFFPATRVKLDVKDSTGLDDSKHSENMYCYELIVPQSQSGRLYQIMLSEIENAFGLTAKLEQQKTKVLVLVKVGSGPKPTTGEKLPKPKPLVFQFRGSAAALASDPMWGKGLEERLNRPVLDETGLGPDFKFDLSWDDLPKKNLDQLRAELRKNGLDLQEAEREIEMLVIRDRSSQLN